MISRVKDLARRATRSRRAAPLFALGASRYRRGGRRGTNPVVATHYGMLVGRHFEDDAAAARHYFSSGWRLGVVPTPFVDVPGAHFSLAKSLRVRNALARVTRGADTASFLGGPSRLVPEELALEVVTAAGSDWLAALTRLARAGRVPVMLGADETSWGRYLARCRELTDAARIVHAERLIDLDFYQHQVGGPPFLSSPAALDDLVSNGEVDGRTPHPFFEPEWYRAHDRSQIRRGRPASQLLDFVSRGELGQAGPHFWGQEYLTRLGDDRPSSLLRHFTDHAGPAAPCPSSSGVPAVDRSVAEAAARSRVGDYHRGLQRLQAHGPVLDRHHLVDSPPARDTSCLVVIDERHLFAGLDGLTTVVEQVVDGLRVVVVEDVGTVRSPALQDLVDRTACLDVIARRPGETIGSIVRRLLDEVRPELWARWSPGDRWDPDFVATAASALRLHPDAPAAATIADGVPQPWLRTDDAVWVDDLRGSGVVLRAAGPSAALPRADLDRGFVEEILIGLASAGPCVVLTRPLARARPADPFEHDVRATANAARARHIVRFEAPTVDVGVAIPTYEDWEMTLTAVRRVLETCGEHDVRVVVVDNGSRRPVASILAACFLDDPRVEVLRVPRNTDFALGSTLGAAAARGRTTVFLNNDTSVQPGWLDPLLTALAEGAAGVQPLLLYGDRTVQSAGTVFLGGMTMPSHLLSGVHPRDVGSQVDDYPFSAVTAACLAVRTEHVAALDGFDPRYVNGMEDVDFCLRLKDLAGAPLRVRTDSRVVHFESRSIGRGDHHDANRDRFAERWSAALQELDDRRILDAGPVALDRVERIRWPSSPLWTGRTVLTPRRDPIQVTEHRPRLRWAIKSAATGDLLGDMWGDTFFAESLAGALRRLDQDVVVDREPSHNRVSAGWDDVTLTLRGLTEYVPQPGAVNLLWIISHPDLVTRHELSSGFARIYSAGAGWARDVRERWGIDVQPLLQATDVEKFHPGVDRGPDRQGVLFVGRTRGVPRVIVKDVIEAGGEPEVYGDDGWEQFIEPRFVKGTGIHNDDVPQAYGSAAVVLNDHWADMAKHGFFSNRLFDAAATGARVISDRVPGLADLFGPQVQAYNSVQRLRELLDPSSPHWPEEDELARLAHRVTQEHSFDARARVLLDDALHAIRERR
ncbi:hypothetical protein GCM10009821_14150 [Aeromicrobium halocynthiae]|uniref:Glycosyltransferase n=1 Tax=Aeromicrobium halocynthiae TaxID=560557 RepID=A0ABN2W173_9ACTN